jgi:hypothetical protein
VTPPSGEATNHHRGNIGNDGRTGGISQPISGPACEVSASWHTRLPFMVDIMCGPNSPRTKEFIMAQWRALPIDQEDLAGRIQRPACIGPPLQKKICGNQATGRTHFTASLVLHIVVEALVRACRVGKAVIKIPRVPQVTTAGDKISWLQMDSRASIERAMIPMAPSLELESGSFVAKDLCDTLPRRKVILPTMREAMGADDIYVRHGNHQHRQPMTSGPLHFSRAKMVPRRNAPPSAATT